MFKVRIHCIDYCLAPPTDVDFAASRAPIARSPKAAAHDGSGDAAVAKNEVRVPIIRIFGANAADGRIACAHIHGIFPYLYVPFDDSSFSIARIDDISKNIRHGIDQAVGRRTVLAVILVRGVPFYGFHVGFRPYLKVYLYDPSAVTRVAELFRKGRLAGVPVLMPHESHIPFLLQFMTDYNLYGCDIVEAEQARPRPRPRPRPPVGNDDGRASCPLEVDIFAHHILNRHAVPERWQHESIPEVPNAKDERLVSSLAALWREMAARYDKKGKKKDAESRKIWDTISTQEAFAQLGATASDPRRTPAAWIHEDEYRKQVADIIAAEREGEEETPPRPSYEQHLPTLRQAVEVFYPKAERSENKKKRKREPSLMSQLGVAGGTPASSDGPSSLTGTQRRTRSATAHASRSQPASQPASLPEFNTNLEIVLIDHRASREWRQSQQLDSPARSQDSSTTKKKKTKNSGRKEGHRPLSQVYPVVKSAFTRSQSGGLSQAESKSSSTLSGQTQREEAATNAGKRVRMATDVPTTYVLEDKASMTTPSADDKNTLDVLSENKRSTRRARSERSESRGHQPPWRHLYGNVFAISKRPPTVDKVLSTLRKYGPDQIHQDAYFSNAADRSTHPEDAVGVDDDDLFVGPADVTVDDEVDMDEAAGEGGPHATTRAWEYAMAPPSRSSVEAWLKAESREKKKKNRTSDDDGSATPKRPIKSHLSQAERDALRKPRETLKLDMRVLCLEVHAPSRGMFLPNPEQDAVEFVFWRVSGGSGDLPADGAAGSGGLHLGDRNGGVISAGRPVRDNCTVDVVADERALLRAVVALVHALDPDILAGYEILASSWGYLSERAAHHGVDLWQALSRVAQPRVVPFHEQHHQGVTGRYMLSIHQAMRADVSLRQYTLESAAWHVLGRKVPFYRAHVLTAWGKAGATAHDVGRLVQHYRRRTAVSLALIETTELVARTSEQARILGTDFASVLERGSQFKVESVMLRVAKPENYILPSPSHEQVGQQNAAACQPLVLEPRSGFYSSPVVVLDFTSLYPSLMIAYNLCYSTYAGRLDPLYEEKKVAGGVATVHPEERSSATVGSGEMDGANDNDNDMADEIARHEEQNAKRLGFMTYERPRGLLAELQRLGLVISPTGTMYVGAQTRQSLLAKMLGELLDTRAMVKAALKSTAATRLAERQRLHNRQLALKLLANVTYGYTSASFSGRMPCVEVADSIVQTGRQTLDKAIALIHAVPRWQAEVVYGDTDSLFVHLPGRTRQQAFRIGAEMAQAVTAINPHPVRLKFEKVYHPCVLLAKKRYVGYKYETAQQREEEPVFDAKGIETVRRDGSPVASKILEASLRLLFDTADLSRIKAFVLQQFADVMHGRVSMADLCFSREVRAAYKAPPPGAVVAARRMAHDARATLVPGERVPYVVVAGPPGMALRDRCVAPEEVVRNRSLRLDADYYIQNSIIPPLDRILRLVGVDVQRWYAAMPKGSVAVRTVDPAPTQPGAGAGAGAGAASAFASHHTLDIWLKGSHCAMCDQPVRPRPRRRRRQQYRGEGDDAGESSNDDETATRRPPAVLCKPCGQDTLGTMVQLQHRLRRAELAYQEIMAGCRSCAGLGPADDVRCENMTCPVYFVRTERSVQVKIERAKAPLIAALGRRGMQDLAW